MSELAPKDLELKIPVFNGRFRIACAIRDVARVVAEKQRLDVDVDEILFVYDDTETRAKTASDIFRIPKMWSDVIYQLTMKRFLYVIKFVNVNLDDIRGQKNVFPALIYHELRHIKRDEKFVSYLDKTHDIEDWSELSIFGDWERDSISAKKMPNFLIGNKEVS